MKLMTLDCEDSHIVSCMAYFIFPCQAVYRFPFLDLKCSKA